MVAEFMALIVLMAPVFVVSIVIWMVWAYASTVVHCANCLKHKTRIYVDDDDDEVEVCHWWKSKHLSDYDIDRIAEALKRKNSSR